MLPDELYFKEEYLKGIDPNIDFPSFFWNKDPAVEDVNHPLAQFLNFYFRIIHAKSDYVHGALDEVVTAECFNIGVIRGENQSLRNKSAGGMDRLRAYRVEVAKTRDSALSNGWKPEQWPIDCLESEIIKIDLEIASLEKYKIKPIVISSPLYSDN